MTFFAILFPFLLNSIFPVLTPDQPKPLYGPDGPPAWAQDLEIFSIQTTDKSLKIRVFDVEGTPIPATIYRFHQGEETTYEAGRELNRGLYLVHVHSAQAGKDTLYKLIKIH